MGKRLVLEVVKACSKSRALQAKRAHLLQELRGDNVKLANEQKNMARSRKNRISAERHLKIMLTALRRKQGKIKQHEIAEMRHMSKEFHAARRKESREKKKLAREFRTLRVDNAEKVSELRTLQQKKIAALRKIRFVSIALNKYLHRPHRGAWYNSRIKHEEAKLAH